MKPTSRWDLVKLDRSVLKIAAVTTVVAVLAVQLVLLLSNDRQARMDRFGTAAARALAGLSLEPLLRQDRLHLGVIGNRLAETPEISGVASYSSNNEVLASTGDVQGPQYSQPVTLDDNIVGYVRVALYPPAFTESGSGRALAMLAVVLLVPLLVSAAWTFAAAVRKGEFTLSRGRVRAQANGTTAELTSGAGNPDETATRIEADGEDPGPAVRHYLLAINLYNQLTLASSEREFERSLCLELSSTVAQIYRGQVVTLPGVGALLDFDHSEDEDRPFQVLCAAFLLARLLYDEAPFGRYRLGLNLATCPADETLPLDDPAIADAALLSALAREGSLAISAPCADALAPDEPAPRREERFESQPLVNPLLDELTTSNPGCRLVTSLAASCTALVVQQAEQLKTQRESAMSSPSTF